MTTTFGGVLLPAASKLDEQPVIAIRDGLLLCGKHRIQSNTNTGLEILFECMGTKEQKAAVQALIGQSETLITPQNGSGFTKMYISSFKNKESDNPLYFYFTVGFKEDTT
jgi:hypothetical protein